ncbi:hypothetical protein [Streptomyces coelicoflavus]|uniref:hypothetical protein n=1 Tax=Streptomyces coelicoflavus TaxID=285562 RepID=UPI000D598CA4|nr:hypothetical protein [Streptomyces coelicoflavus]
MGLMLRNTLFILVFVAFAAGGGLVHVAEGVRTLVGFTAFLKLLRLFGLLSQGDGLVLNDLGIGVDSPTNLAALRWSEAISVELRQGARDTVLGVPATEVQDL